MRTSPEGSEDMATNNNEDKKPEGIMRSGHVIIMRTRSLIIIEDMATNNNEDKKPLKVVRT